MRELVEYLVKALVDEPEMVKVEDRENEGEVIIEITVAPDDMGKVIGKQGRIAKSIRTVAKAAAARQGKKVVVDILQ